MAKLSPAIRDALVLVAVFAVLLGGLWAYTGTWPPAVIVESGSMMHADNEVTYGRIGTIDPGDLVLVKHVSSVDDVMTLVENGTTHYGKAGDVIVYYRANDRGLTPIIHRAVAYVQLLGTGDNARYYVRWSDQDPCVGGSVQARDVAFDAQGSMLQGDAANASGLRTHTWCVFDQKGVYLPDIPVSEFQSTPAAPRPYAPIRSGFLTKGDNPATNQQTDQISSLSHDENGSRSPVPLSWVEGKARAELPWLGLIKLALASKVNENNPPRDAQGHILWVKIGSAYAPKDLWVMLGISLFVLVGIPLIYDGYKAVQARRGKGALGPPTALTGTASDATSVELRWSPPATGAPPASYHVYRGATRIGTTQEPTFRDSGLAGGVSYLYAVSALDAKGVEGPRTPMVSVSTAQP